MDVLESLFAVGERMQEALEAQDLELFFSLAEERGTVLDELKAYVRPAEAGPEWERLASALAEQQRALLAAAVAQEQRLGETLVELERFKSARQHYQQPAREGTILNGDLCV